MGVHTSQWPFRSGPSMQTGVLFLAFLTIGVSGCQQYGEELLNKDPSLVHPPYFTDLSDHVAYVILDGEGWIRRTPWGERYLDYFVRLIECQPPGTLAPAFGMLSFVGMIGNRYWNLGEAIVQEGYTDRVCAALLKTADRWEAVRERRVDPELESHDARRLYEAVVELKFRQYAHRNKALAGHLGLERRDADGRIAFKFFTVGRVNKEEVRTALVPRLLDSGDQQFRRAYCRLYPEGSANHLPTTAPDHEG